MTTLAICGGRLVDPAAGVDALKDILLRDGRVAEIAGTGQAEEHRTAPRCSTRRDWSSRRG